MSRHGLIIAAIGETADLSRSTLDDPLRFESLLADLSSEFVNLQSHLIDDAIEDALRRLSDVLGVDRAALAEVSAADGTLLFTHAWRADGSASLIRQIAARTLFPYGLQRILKGELHAFSSVEELPPDAPDREYLLTTAGFERP